MYTTSDTLDEGAVEKQSAAATTSSISRPSENLTHLNQKHHRDHNHHLNTRAYDKLRHFLHPNGKRIHIANSPEEAARLRINLSTHSKPHPDAGGNEHAKNDFDVLISGTPEHLAAVRDARSHHEARREALRHTHGEVFEQFAHVHAELEMLNYELERVTSAGVSLEAHFGKYGYSAQIRSYDDGEGEGSRSPSVSGQTTPQRDAGGRRGGLGGAGNGSRSTSTSTPLPASAAERGYATTPLKLFKRPTLRQYFHRGILWRASGSEEVQSFELFVDLLYVGIIAINGDAAAEHPTASSLLHFVITFTLSWKIWNDMALIISWFETDDIFQRCSVLFLLTCLFGYTTNITQAFATTYPSLLGFYLASRLYMALYLLGMAYLLPTIAPIMIWHVSWIALAIILYITSIHTPSPSPRLPLILLALVLDIFGQFSYIWCLLLCQRLGGRLHAWCDRTFQFWPAINIEHRVERTNAFVTLVFGYTVVAMLYQSARNGIGGFFGKAALGLVQAFGFNWLYFEVDGANLHLHAIRRHKVSAMVWGLAHLPFISAFVLGGGALSRLVVAHDPGAASRVEDLTEAYRERSEGEVVSGVRWFYCAGFGVAMAFMAVISTAHVHREVEGLRLPKRFRLGFRLVIAVILICLPLAEGLNSLELVGTVTGLVVLTLIAELWANSCCHETLFQRSKPCQYIGRCGKKDLRAMIEDDEELDIDRIVCEKTKRSGIMLGPST